MRRNLQDRKEKAGKGRKAACRRIVSHELVLVMPIHGRH